MTEGDLQAFGESLVVVIAQAHRMNANLIQLQACFQVRQVDLPTRYRRAVGG
ncbi:MAG: hypothetical protein IPN53_22870 [Comamonadaceae bacterium]|nr:hypothetical protein [Comamonadaceae bacterium]